MAAIQKEQLDANRCWQIPDQHLHSFLCSFTPKEPKSTQMPGISQVSSSHLASILLFCLWLMSSLSSSSAHLSSSSPTHSALTATYPSQVIPQEPSFPRWVPLLTVSRPFQPGISVPPTWRKLKQPWETLCTSYDSVVFLVPGNYVKSTQV